MYLSSISYNINGVGVPDYPRLEEHITRIYPRWLLVMDNPVMCKYFAAKLPFMNVITRNWALTQGDENVYARLTPLQFLEARLPEATDNVWLYTANEAGVNVKWDIELMQLIIARKLTHVRLVLGNYSVGTPSTIDWTMPDKKEWFRLLDQYRSQFVLGLHEYFAGIAPSGFVGGYPDGSWVDGRTGLHPNYENRLNWPADPTSIGQLWHCGRVMSVNAGAKFFGYNPPRVVITEHGSDALGDMKGWFDRLPKTGDYPLLRAWKSWPAAWAKLLPGRSHEQAYFENVSYLDDKLYSRLPNVEGQLLFTWSSASKWNEFDVSAAREFQSRLEGYVAQKAATNPPPPIPPEPPPGVVMVTLPLQELLDLRKNLQMNADITGRLGLQFATIREDITGELEILDALIEAGKVKSKEA